jgi:hypothetical protein
MLSLPTAPPCPGWFGSAFRGPQQTDGISTWSGSCMWRGLFPPLTIRGAPPFHLGFRPHVAPSRVVTSACAPLIVCVCSAEVEHHRRIQRQADAWSPEELHKLFQASHHITLRRHRFAASVCTTKPLVLHHERRSIRVEAQVLYAPPSHWACTRSDDRQEFTMTTGGRFPRHRRLTDVTCRPMRITLTLDADRITLCGRHVSQHSEAPRPPPSTPPPPPNPGV